MTAIRLARAAHRSRDRLKFAGAYHGHSDGAARPGRLGPRDAGDPGEPRRARRRRRRRPWSCPGTTPQALETATAERHEVAAIIAEPFAGEHGPRRRRRDGFLELLRERADACGALLISRRGDQRLSRRARRCQRAHRRAADLVVLGKILGGGLPAAARRRAARSCSSCSRRSARSTRPARCRATRSRSPPASRRSRCSTTGAYAPLAATTQRLAAGLRAGRAAAAPSASSRCPGLLTVFFAAERPGDLDDVAALRPRRPRRLVP